MCTTTHFLFYLCPFSLDFSINSETLALLFCTLMFIVVDVDIEMLSKLPFLVMFFSPTVTYLIQLQ